MLRLSAVAEVGSFPAIPRMVSINGIRDDQPVDGYVSERPDSINNIGEEGNVSNGDEATNGAGGQPNNGMAQEDAGRRKRIVVVGLGMVAISFM